jgi:hypothetical protein
MTTSTISDRVQRGAALLDARFPGWVDQVNLSTLNLASGCDCILGQRFGDFAQGARLVHLAPETSSVRMGDSSRSRLDAHGFLVDYTPEEYAAFKARARRATDAAMARSDAEYAELTREWTKLITDRRAAAQLAEVEEPALVSV